MDRETLEHVLTIARIRVDEKEKPLLLSQINSIFELLERVKEIRFGEEITEELYNPLREDAAAPSEKDFTEVFPKRRGRYLEVPRNL